MAARLFYLVGASGSGKDSLLRYVREHLPPGAAVVFAHRYITRPADAGGENHIALSATEFATREQQGCFAMHWQAHGLDYGIGIEIHDWLDRGLDVVVNGSRAYLGTAATMFPQLIPVLIQVDADRLRERLTARTREATADLEARLQRGLELDDIGHPALVRIDNNRDIQQAGRDLLHLLLGEES